MSHNASHLHHVVTAVVVVHDGARLLPGLVRAVRDQSYPVERTVGVDTGSRDRSGAALAELLGPDSVFGMEMETGYGEAVASALAHPAGRSAGSRPTRAGTSKASQPTDQPASQTGSQPASQAPGQAANQAPSQAEWIWLLHDDCEPAPDALEHLLAAASRSRTVGVVGPKLMDAADRRVVREAGISTDRAGRRYSGVEPGEIDQGQHDGNRSVLAVSSAGMLVRRDVWEQLDGFDPQLPLFRDDIDFCWRVHAAGYDVRVVSDAVVYHRELSARRVRKAPVAEGNPRLLDRRAALYVLAVNLPLWPMLTVLAGCLAGSVVRSGYFLLTKQSQKAAAQAGALWWLLGHPGLIARERRRRAPGRKEGYAVLRTQLPRARTVGRLAESAAGLLSRGAGYESSGLHSAASDDLDDDIPIPDGNSVVRRLLTSPGVLLFVALAVIALVAERPLTAAVFSGPGPLSGGTLIPAWGGASDLWHEYLAGYHATGVGSAVSAPPYLGVMAALATVLAGKTWLAVDLILLGCVPVAGATAFAATRRFTPVLAVRIWIAATYALLPVAMGAVAAGRIGTAVVFVLLPLIGIALGRMFRGSPRAARRAAWAAGLLSGIAAAFVPLIWLVAVLGGLAAAAAWRWLGPRTVINAAIVAVLPGILLIPWTFRLLTSPSVFFTEAGLLRPGLSVAGLSPGALLLLSPGGPGLPPIWVTAGLVLPAFAALLTRRRPVLVYTGWGVALTGLIIALVGSRIRITPPQGGTPVSSWPGAALAIATAGLLLAATPLLETALALARRGTESRGTESNETDSRGTEDEADETPRAPRRSLSGLAALAGLVVAASAPVLAAGSWLAAGAGPTMSAASAQVLPAFVAAASTGPDRPRTLVLRQDGATLDYSVLRTSDPVLGEPELAPDSASAQALASTVGSLNAAGSGDAGDTGQALGQFDIGYVLMPAPVDQALAQQLNAAAGLQPLTQSASYSLWRVTAPVARVSVLTANGSVVPVASGSVGASTVIAPGTSGTLVLDEATGGWSASLNGHALTPLAHPVNGWAQGFTLPAGGGRLVISRDETARDVSLAVEAVALVIAFALALPGTRSAAVPEPAEITPDEAEAPVPGRPERVEGTRSAHRRRSPAPALVGGPDEAAADDGDLAAAGSVVSADHTARTGGFSRSAADAPVPSRGPATPARDTRYGMGTGRRAAVGFPAGDSPGPEPGYGWLTDPDPYTTAPRRPDPLSLGYSDPRYPNPFGPDSTSPERPSPERPSPEPFSPQPSSPEHSEPKLSKPERPRPQRSSPLRPGFLRAGSQPSGSQPSGSQRSGSSWPDPAASDPAVSQPPDPAGDAPSAPRGPAPDAAPPPARPRRGGAHAARHGKPSRRRRGVQPTPDPLARDDE